LFEVFFTIVQRAEVVRSKLEGVLARWPSEPHALIPLLQTVQENFHYLPPEALEEVARHLKIPLSRVYGVATFYAQFTLNPRGKRHIRICLGTACHVKGGTEIVKKVAERLGLRPGETSEDLEVSLEIVRCLGCCSLAPVMVVGDKLFGRLTPDKALRLVEDLL
jgi:NADH-quinone oxidoreductase subunit E